MALEWPNFLQMSVGPVKSPSEMERYMSRDDETGLSTSEVPSAEDIALVDGAIRKYDDAPQKEKVDIFEGLLTKLAEEFARRYKTTKDHGWIDQLTRLSEATSLMAAEDISSIVEDILEEPDSFKMLRGSKYFSLVKDFSPDASIYEATNASGCLVVVSCNRFQINGSGFPIFEGTMDLLNADQTLARSFDISTGGGSPSHKVRNGPLPPGRYLASTFRMRNDKAGMISGGVGYSVNLDPCDGTAVYNRDAFRIHPDGAPFGTRGCIGVLGDGNTQRAAMELLRGMVATATDAVPLKLCISYSK